MPFSNSKRLPPLAILLFGHQTILMKAIYLLSVVGSLLFPATGVAQTQQPPKKEYLLIASASTLTIAKGQQDSVKLTVVRSKSFKTGESSITFNPPTEAALDVKIKQLTGEPDQYMVYLITTDDTKPGEYNVVSTCTLRNKNKGIVMKLIIN
jgi:hypothetical protein